MQRFFEIKENYRIIEVKCNFSTPSMCRVTIGKLLKLNNYYFVYMYRVKQKDADKLFVVVGGIAISNLSMEMHIR